MNSANQNSLTTCSWTQPISFYCPAGTPSVSLVFVGSDAGLSSDGQQFLANVDSAGPLIIFDIWESLDELVSLAKECCVIRELTPEERVEFGLD